MEAMTSMGDGVWGVLKPVVFEDTSLLLLINIFVSITLVTIFLHRLSSYLISKSELHVAARESAEKFYAGADELMRSEELPEILKNTLYDLILGVTDERFGRIAVRALLAQEKTTSGNHSLSLALGALRKDRPDLANQFFDVVRAAFSSILLSFGHSEHRMLMILTKSATQHTELVKTAERVERQFHSNFAQPIAA